MDINSLKKLQSDASFVALPVDKGRVTAIVNREDYLKIAWIM